MERHEVESSLIRSISYDREKAVLEIRFLNGKLHRYNEVGPEVVEELLDAPSKGRYVNDYRPRTRALASWTAFDVEALAAYHRAAKRSNKTSTNR